MTIDDFLSDFKSKFSFNLPSSDNISFFTKYSFLSDYYSLLSKICSAFASKLFFQEKMVSGFLLSDDERQSLDTAVKFLEGYGYKDV